MNCSHIVLSILVSLMDRWSSGTILSLNDKRLEK